MQNDPLTPAISILGVKVTPITVAQLHRHMEDVIRGGRKELILHVNVHCLNLAKERPWLQEFLNSAEVVLCDGAGVIVGARILGHHIPERITYADWMWQLAEFSANQGFSLFLLGAEPGVAESAAARLLERYPNLAIAGVHHGYFEKEPCSAETQAVIETINAAKPNILLLGFGMPLQEKWLMENWEAIDTNIALTGGAVFDYISGELKRAPEWLTASGFEWLGRLIIEPRRLWRRYLVGNPIFMWRIVKQRLAQSEP